MENKLYAPIIGGNYADPSIIRVGEDYYMTHSSYKLTPGLIIWHSRDLLHWTKVGAALTRYGGDVWAPDFAVHNGRYYIYYPAGGTNWVVTAEHPAGPWSEPVNLGIKGIDPGHTVGPDGKRYLHMSGGYIVELSDDGLSVAGEAREIYEGWRYPEDWVVEGYSLEGPKVTYHNGYYYLTVAIGGTAGPPTSHMAVSSRSRTPWGPWEHSPYNPVVRTWSKEEAWWSKGHASLIDAPDGQWWMVYHAYASGYHTLGRQTLLEPIEWTEDGWFRAAGKAEANPAAEAFKFQDSFQEPGLCLEWQTEGTEPEQRFRTGPGGLIASGASEKERHSPLFYMPAHKRYMAEVEVALEGEVEGRLVLYYNDYAYLGLGVHGGGVRFFRSFKNYATMPSDSGYAWVRIVNDEHIVSFYYSFDGTKWMKYDKVVDASGMHHNTLGGFQSLRIGLDAVGRGKAVFRKFTYKEL
ncbi:family 43 glycosylhydrolase [Paenibacillus campinasensis]|uniref:Family 43 glycosylhydrolase n=1 Tax=Paenibacillus campinasensis TaxID=66347 RepID=A0ABW9SVM1_9BACL|nr:family 43 glycosylhydrolase [Paenibacillus campinasensis]MUG64513.1 family 43 glycosylhydrolase [Paenibacillus campinasensis]